MLLPDILEGRWHYNAKAKEKHISVGVDKGAEGVKVVLTRGVAQLKGEWLSVHMHHSVICVNRLRDAIIHPFYGVREEAFTVGTYSAG